MSALARTAADLAAALSAAAEPDLFGALLDPAVEEARLRFRRRMARTRRRDAVLAWLATPWAAWEDPTSAAARIARRFLARHPERDRPDPDLMLLTDREAADDYHLEEEALEAQKSRCGRW